MSLNPLQYRSTKMLDAGRVEQVYDVESHPGLRVVRTLGLGEDSELEVLESKYHLANGTVFDDADQALAEWERLGDEMELLDKIGELLLRHRHGLMRPLWEHRTAEQKWPYISQANTFKRLAETLGLSIERRARQ